MMYGGSTVRFGSELATCLWVLAVEGIVCLAIGMTFYSKPLWWRLEGCSLSAWRAWMKRRRARNNAASEPLLPVAARAQYGSLEAADQDVLDEDVRAEQARVMSGSAHPSSHAVVLQQLHKVRYIGVPSS
jgi:hypothetical protein